jgi:hypothetical protein
LTHDLILISNHLLFNTMAKHIFAELGDASVLQAGGRPRIHRRHYGALNVMERRPQDAGGEDDAWGAQGQDRTHGVQVRN